MVSAVSKIVNGRPRQLLSGLPPLPSPRAASKWLNGQTYRVRTNSSRLKSLDELKALVVVDVFVCFFPFAGEVIVVVSASFWGSELMALHCHLSRKSAQNRLAREEKWY